MADSDGLSIVDPTNPRASFLAVFVLIALDAVIPIFPGETTLNAASTAAADGTLELVPVIVMGALGAIVGDSALFWLHAERVIDAARVAGSCASVRQAPKVAAGTAPSGSRPVDGRRHQDRTPLVVSSPAPGFGCER